MPQLSTFARRRARCAVRAGALFVAFVALAAPAWPQQKALGDLTSASLEDLMNIEIVSVSKTEQKLSQAASAVFVITQEDIRRSGALNIPDLLRMVPGLDVAQIDSNTWAISARGFNARFAHELFVMVDGRSVYTETFGGVYWDVLNLPLEDIERIEVIRGPGGSVWGANAVNGVINIVTKKSSETHGVSVVSDGGNVTQGSGTVQFGGHLGASSDFRAYTQYFNNDHFTSPAGQDGGDGWHLLQGGFRTDSSLSPKDTLKLEGDLYASREGQPTNTFPSVTSPATVPLQLQVDLSGGFLQGVWNRQISPRSDTTLQVSYNQYERDDQLREARNTFDVTFQHHLRVGAKHDVVWGAEVRDSQSNTDGNLFISFVPAERHTHLFGVFAQDEIAVVPDRFTITVGTKVEYNTYTAINVMPTARAAWTPTVNQALWVAVSDAVRSPSDIDESLRASAASFTEPNGTQAIVSVVGNPRIDDESLIAYELGYRKIIHSRLSLDFAAYYNDYGHQETVEPAAPFSVDSPPPTHLIVPFIFKNWMHGETHGFELAASWKVTNWWTLNPGYAFETIHMHLAPQSQDTSSQAGAEGSSPDHSAQLRSHVVLPHGFSWDTSAYFVDRLTDPQIPSYTRLDSELSWRFAEKARLGIVGQNLLRDRHVEFVDTTEDARTTLIKRSVYAQLSCQF